MDQFKNYLLALSAAGMIAAFTTACNEGTTDEPVEDANEVNDEMLANNMEETAEFMTAVTSMGMFEIEAANMAESMSASADVKALAAMLKTDHTAVNEEVKMMAANKGITLPVATSEGNQNELNDLKDDTGDEFNKDYLEKVISDHKKAINMFEGVISDNDYDADAKSFAAKTLPVLQAHLAEAEKWMAMMK